MLRSPQLNAVYVGLPADAHLLPQASGNIGKPVVAALLADGSFTVTAVARHESKATFPAGVKVVKSDFSPESLVEAFKGQDALVSAVNAMGEDQEVKFIDAALKAGIKRMITNDVRFESV